jgi:hypothetical protein
MSTDKFRGTIPKKVKTKALVNVQVQHQPERVRLINILLYRSLFD